MSANIRPIHIALPAAAVALSLAAIFTVSNTGSMMQTTMVAQSRSDERRADREIEDADTIVTSVLHRFMVESEDGGRTRNPILDDIDGTFTLGTCYHIHASGEREAYACVTSIAQKRSDAESEELGIRLEP